MMISQPALLCLNATWQRLTRRHAIEGVPVGEPVVAAEVELDPVELLNSRLSEPYFGLTASDGAGPVPVAPEREPVVVGGLVAIEPLTANERRARAAALRGLALSRGRRFDAAGSAFTEAARLDPLLDLTRTPAFWKLERAAHEAAINAYVQAGRERDAAVLRARVQSTFRPKPLRVRQQHVGISP